LNVVFEKGLGGDQLNRDADFNAVVSQTLSESTRNQDKGSVFEFLDSDVFEIMGGGRVEIDLLAFGLEGGVAFVGVDVVRGVFEEFSGSVEVGFEASGVGGVEFF